MADILKRLLCDPKNQAIVWGVTGLYLTVFLIAVGELSFHATAQAFSGQVSPNWSDLMFRQRAPFQFEAVAVLNGPFGTWLIAPVNIAVGTVLGVLTGMQMALVRIARQCTVSCGLSPASSLFAGLPGLLAGSACCAPLILIVLGIQVTASLITLMGLMIPIAFTLLVGGFAYSLRVASRRCAEAST